MHGLVSAPRARIAALLGTGSGLVPSFDLNFARLDNPVTKYGFSFTRATSATYVNSSGQIATAASGALRYTYDPVTLSALGVLIEEARTNSVTASSGLNASTGTTVAQDTNGPDGAATAWTVTTDASAGSHFAEPNTTAIAFTSGTTYTYSVFVKSGTESRVQLTGKSSAFGSSQYANFSLSGSGSVLASTGCTASITKFSNGWYRCSIAVAATASVSSAFVVALINADAATRLPSFTSASLTLKVFGNQIEAGAFPTSYIPTAGASATRNADVLTLTGTADAIFPGYNASAGTIVIDAIVPPTAATYNSLLSINSGSNANQIYVYANQTPYLYLELRTASTTVASPRFNTALTVGNQIRAALAYAENDAAVYVGGAAGQTDNTCPLPTGVTSMIIGSGYSLGRWNGTISRLDYYPRRLDNAVLQRLTS